MPEENKQMIPELVGKISRRDFLKLAKRTATSISIAALIQSFHIRLPIDDESNLPPIKSQEVEATHHPEKVVARATTIHNILAQAELSNDTTEIEQANKLLILWAFTETAAQLGSLAGYSISSSFLRHYLDGNGRPIDMSSLMLTTPEFAQLSYTNALSQEFYRRSSKLHSSVHGFNQFYSRFMRILKSSDGYEFPNYIERSVEKDIFYALGGFTTKLRVKSSNHQITDTPTSLLVDVTLGGITLECFDLFSFHRNIPLDINTFSQEFLSSYFATHANNLTEILEKYRVPRPIRAKINSTMEHLAEKFTTNRTSNS